MKKTRENFKELWAVESQVYNVRAGCTVFICGKASHAIENNNSSVSKLLMMKGNFKESLSGSCFNKEIL